MTRNLTRARPSRPQRAASRSATFQPKRRLAIDARTAGCEWTGAMDYDDTGWLLMQAAQKAVVSGDDCGC